MIALYNRLSQHTAYQRFFALRRRLPPNWAHFPADVDYVRRLALVAARDRPDADLIGVALYEPTAGRAPRSLMTKQRTLAYLAGKS